MKIKMPFCANMNTGVPWDSGLPFLRALGPAHNRLKTTAGCFVPFEFCTDKNRSDIKCDSASLKGGGTSGRRQIRCVCTFPDFLFCLLLFQLTPPVTSDQWIWERSQSSHLKRMRRRFPEHKHKRMSECFFRFLHFFTRGRVTITTFREHLNAVRDNRMSEVIPGLLCCYTHWQQKKTVLFLNTGTNSPHLTGGFALRREKHLSNVNSLTCEEIGGPDLQLEVKLVVHGVDDLLL